MPAGTHIPRYEGLWYTRVRVHVLVFSVVLFIENRFLGSVLNLITRTSVSPIEYQTLPFYNLLFLSRSIMTRKIQNSYFTLRLIKGGVVKFWILIQVVGRFDIQFEFFIT